MIYLLIEIFVYLAAALALGVAAGWLWRHRDAAAEIDVLERRALTGGDRVPVLETALREREERLQILERTLAEREHVLDRALCERDEVLEQALASRDAANAELAALHEQVLAQDASREWDGRDANQRLKQAEAEMAALRDRLAESVQALATAERRVEELSRERALQARALGAMEQQLELAREQKVRSASL